MAHEPLLPCNSADLLARAIETLRARMLPHMTETPDREASALALRALGIVQAELTSDPAIPGRELAEIEALLGRSFDGDAVAARRALASAIRARSLSDGPTQVRLRDHLLKATANRLRLANPKYMTRRQRRAESSY
jgi:uncharacterized protein DUF6285